MRSPSSLRMNGHAKASIIRLHLCPHDFTDRKHVRIRLKLQIWAFVMMIQPADRNR